MSIITIFTASAQDFEAGTSPTTQFNVSDFTSTSGTPTATGYDVFVSTTSDFNVTYNVPFSVNGMSDIDISYELSIGGGSNNLPLVDSLKLFVDGIEVYFTDVVPLSSTQNLSLSNINGTNLTMEVYVSLTGSWGSLTFNYFSLTNVSGSSVGINENISDDFNIYSYNSNIVVKTDEYTQYTIKVYSMRGQLVMNETTNGNLESTMNVPSGIYIVQLSNENEKISKKVSLDK